jgi:hypothetical protein
MITILVLAAGVFPTAGYGVLSVSPADFRAPRVCFYVSAICVGAALALWSLTTVQPFWARALVTGIVGALMLIGLTEGLRWVTGRENAFTADLMDGSPQPKAAAGDTRLSLQFFGDDRYATAVVEKNIFAWYDFVGFIRLGMPDAGSLTAEQAKALDDINKNALYNVIYITFDKPVEYREVLLNFPAGPCLSTK